jgi:hypothetical protein
MPLNFYSPHKVSLTSKTPLHIKPHSFIFLRIIMKPQNPTPNGFKGLITPVGTILGSHMCWNTSSLAHPIPCNVFTSLNVLILAPTLPGSPEDQQLRLASHQLANEIKQPPQKTHEPKYLNCPTKTGATRRCQGLQSLIASAIPNARHSGLALHHVLQERLPFALCLAVAVR